MQFLFEAVTISGNKAQYFLIYKTETGYFAELVDQPGIGFNFYRGKDQWISNDPAMQNEAEQIGEVINIKGCIINKSKVSFH